MSDASARDVIVTAASDCPKVAIRGDVYELADDIIAALSAAGFVIVPREPTKQMVDAVESYAGRQVHNQFKAWWSCAVSAEGKQ